MRYFFLFITFFASFVSKGQVSPVLTVPKGHKDVINNCYFTPNDKYLISTDNDHVLCIWDGDDGRQLFTLRDSLGSFSKVEVDNSTATIAALTSLGQLYLISFRQLKIMTRVDSVADFSLNKATGSVFFIASHPFRTSVKKYDPKTAMVQKTAIPNFQKATKLIALSETSIALQDELKGVIIANTSTGKIQPVANRLSIYLTLWDYHPSGNLLCSWAANSGTSIYNVDIKTNTIKGEITLGKQARNLDCAYTARQGTIIISKLEETDDMGTTILEAPSLYLLKTGKKIKEIGSEYIPDLDEMNLNTSGKSLISKYEPGPGFTTYLQYDFLSDTAYGVMNESGYPGILYRFACANKSKKIAVFCKDFLLPLIYPEGEVPNNQLTGIKKYGSLAIDIYKTADKKTKNGFHFLPGEERAVNDSISVALPEIWDEESRMNIGNVYRRKNNIITDSFRFLYKYVTTPLAGSEHLFWSVDSIFYVLDLSTLRVSDSLPMPGMRVYNFVKAGENILIQGVSGDRLLSYQYNISQRRLVRTSTPFVSGFSKPYQEKDYVRSLEGEMISEAMVRDYDYKNGVEIGYPFRLQRTDSMMVYDTATGNNSIQVLVSVPYASFTSMDSTLPKSRHVSEEIEELPVLQVRYWDKDRYIIMTTRNKLFVYSFIKDTLLKEIDCPTNPNISVSSSRLFVQEHNKYLIVSDKDRNDCFIVDVEAAKILFHLKGFYNPAIRQPDGLLVLEDAAFGNFYVYNNKYYNYVSSITPFSAFDYIVTTNSGLFDGTEKAIENLYLLINDTEDKNKPWKTIDLTQLKAKYYIPGLWDKLVAGDSTDLPDVESMKKISLAPEIITDTGYSFTKPYRITVIDKGGGIGAVRVAVNGKEVIADARKSPVGNSKKISISLDLAAFRNFFGPGNNTIQVFSTNRDSSLTSKGLVVRSANSGKPIANPKLFIISIGTSDYKGTEIDLQYSSKDALDMATALAAGSKKLFGADSTKVYTLTSIATDSLLQPSKKNIERVFKDAGREATAKDIIILYLSGHGINIGGANSDFYYLTKDAYTANPAAYSFKEVLKYVGVSSNEFTDYLKKIPALKQLFIIDACASGKVVENLIAHRDIPFSTLKALDRMKDRTGTHIITGCTADAVSYEASRFGQGILTYSLLEGMRGASLRDNKFLDVSQWFQYARDRVPQLAEGLGGIQTPQVYSPSGNQSFDIGELDEDEKKQVPLAAVKPVFIRSIFQEEEKFADILSLGKQLDKTLYELSSQYNNTFLYLPVDEFPNACQVLGRYKITPGGIVASVKILRSALPDAAISFMVTSTDIASLSKEIVRKIMELK